VRDESLLKNLFENHKPAWVLHAAAHKHVALMEDGTYILPKTAAAYNGTAGLCWRRQGQSGHGTGCACRYAGDGLPGKVEERPGQLCKAGR